MNASRRCRGCAARLQAAACLPAPPCPPPCSCLQLPGDPRAVHASRAAAAPTTQTKRMPGPLGVESQIRRHCAQQEMRAARLRRADPYRMPSQVSGPHAGGAHHRQLTQSAATFNGLLHANALLPAVPFIGDSGDCGTHPPPTAAPPCPPCQPTGHHRLEEPGDIQQAHPSGRGRCPGPSWRSVLPLAAVPVPALATTQCRVSHRRLRGHGPPHRLLQCGRQAGAVHPCTPRHVARWRGTIACCSA